jgi:hypothetical protein
MNNELLDVIKLYLQKNILENKSIEEREFSYKIAKYLVDNPGAKTMKLGNKEIEITMSPEDAKKIVEPKESNLQEKRKKRRKKRKKKTDFHKGGQDSYRTGRSPKQLKKQINLTRAYANARSEKAKQAIRQKIDKSRAAEKPVMAESINRLQLRKLLLELYLENLEEKKKTTKKKKKKKTKRKTLSKKTMSTLRKKAKSSGYTAGSLAAEYRKGLGAYYSSGSRKGMGSHQWAMGRVNSAIRKGNPSWANLKKSSRKA